MENKSYINSDELEFIQNKVSFQSAEIEKLKAELLSATIELTFSKVEKGKRAKELGLANVELDFQNSEKEKRETENSELEKLTRIANSASQYSRSLIEASLDPLITISLKGKITDINEAMVNVTGVLRIDLIGSDFKNYFTDSEKASEVYQEVFDKGFVTNYPLTIIDGKLTDVLFNGSVYKDDKGKILGAVIVARDITISNKNEKELIEAKVYAELALEIAEEAKIKAEQAVKAKQQFLSNMSHEIRTPMNAIIGFTKVVLKTELTEKQREYLNAIKISGDALIVLINDILDLAKVDSGKMSFESIPFKLRASISSMLHLFELKIQEKNLDFIKMYDDKIPEVLIGDPVRLHQIILNLLSNALKFTNKGSITVKVKLLSENDECAVVEFSVTDTGIGISDKKIDSIFENFQQASSGTSRLYGGTGLGLAIVKQLVESQGGKIDVTSEISRGSTFRFTLTFRKTNDACEKNEEDVSLNYDKKNINVLVVEDIPLNQLLMKTLLDEFGFKKEIASNGIIAIQKLKENTFDIILMDLQMPEMNGFEATEYIRDVMKLKTPIIALTADVTTVDLDKCKAVGMDDYIAKPLDERLLYSKIISLIKKTNSSSFPIDKQEEKKLKLTDLSYLIKKTKSNPALMSEMISLYLEQTPTLINSMKESFLNKDWHLLHATIHKIIPSFSIVGMSKDFEKMAIKIQEYSASQELSDEILTMVSDLEKVCELACLELKIELHNIKNNLNE